MLREWLISIVLCSVACSLVYILVPHGETEKIMKTIISLFIIAVIASPLASLLRGTDDFSFSKGEYGDTQYAEQANLLLISSAENAVRQAVIDTIPSLANSDIEVTATFENESTLCVKSVRIKLNNDALNPEEIREKLHEKLEITAEVIP